MSISISGNGGITGTTTNYSFDQSVSIGGTLTYEDVTNIDSVGVITARQGLDTPTNLVLRTGGTERLRITSAGKIGIGTDNPSDKLSVVSSLTTDSVLRLQGGNSAGKGSGIRLMKGASAVGYIGPESWLFGSANTSDTLVISQNAQANLSITSAGLVGIGLTNPTNSHGKGLHIADTNAGIRIQNTADTGWAYMEYADESNTVKYVQGYRDVSGLYGIRPGNSLSASTGLTIDSSGYVTKPNHPAFYAYRNDGSGQTSSGDQVFNETRTNNGSHYDTTNGRFTAPVSGMYFFSCSVQLYGSSASPGTALSFRINGTDFHGSYSSSNPIYDEKAGDHTMLYFSAVISLTKDQYVTVWTSTTVRGMQSYFTGYLIG
jgi:hypothetical protein